MRNTAAHTEAPTSPSELKEKAKSDVALMTQPTQKILTAAEMPLMKNYL